MHRSTLPVAAICLSSTVILAAGDPPIRAELVEVAGAYSWGYKCGVKQPEGSYAYGVSMHQVSRKTGVNPDYSGIGTPDAILWVFMLSST